MAIIVGVGVGILSRNLTVNSAENNPNISEASWYSSPFILNGERFEALKTEDTSGPVVKNTPRTSSPAKVIQGVGKTHSFADDFYNRIHITPSSLALGNLLSSQTREFEVWNSYFSSKLLSSITQSGTDGITLTQPTAAPTTFASLEARTYVLSISTDGAPVISAAYVFNFPDNQPAMTITGRRVVLWPFVAQNQFTETLEWKTDILTTQEGEQRIALRNAPRQSFTYDFQLTPYQFSRAKAIATQWGQRVYGIPVWNSVTKLKVIESGATVIEFDTTNQDYRDNDILMLWESDTSFEALETLVVSDTQIELKLPLTRTYNDVYIVPVRFARTLSGVEFKRDSNVVTRGRGTFLVTENIDLGAVIGKDEFNSVDVVTDRSVILGDLSEKIVRSVDLFDNGSGVIEVATKNDYVTATQTLTFDSITDADAWNVRQWLYSKRGKQRTFWLPTWNEDLQVVLDISAESMALTCLPINYPLYYTTKTILIQHTNGTKYYRTIVSGVTNEDGTEQLSINESLGIVVTPAEIEFVCFMQLCRLSSDNITISHKGSGRQSITLNVTEVPE